MSIHAAITDAELLLYHYCDGLDAAERVRIATALIAQPQLASRLQTLVAQLDAAAAIPDVPVPPQTRQRWHAALERCSAAATEPAPRSDLLDRWRWPTVAAIAAAAIAVAFRLGMQSAADRPAPLLAASQSLPCDTAKASTSSVA